MRKTLLAAAAATILALSGIHAEAQAGPPAGWIHVDAEAGCVFGNAPHHWFRPSGEGLLFALVFESDDDNAQPVAIELAVTPEGYAKLPDHVKKYYHDHHEEIAMGGITLPGMDPENTKKTLEFLATTHGRMILISEVADLAPIERLHIPTKPQAYTGTFWSYTPAQ
jgi:hypothetical protein